MTWTIFGRARRAARTALAKAARVDSALRAILLLFLLVTMPGLSTVPIWDARTYYDSCLMPALQVPFHPLNFNCFGHPSMLYMLLFAPGQWLSGGSAVLLNLTNVALGCLAIVAFWRITGAIWPHAGSRVDRAFATGILVVWPAAVANSLNMNPDYGVFVFFLLFLCFQLERKMGLAALSGAFLVLSKETGVVLYGLATVLYLLVFLRREEACRRLWPAIRRHWLLFVPGLVSLGAALLTLARGEPVVWGGSRSVVSVLKRFVVFNPGEILTGPYGPAIWTLSFSWVLTACLFAAVVKLALVRRSREALAADTFPRRPLIFLLLAFAGTTYALTRYETFVNVRYLLAIAPLLILVFAVAARVLLPRPALRYAFLSIVFLLLLASDFRTIDPVSRRLWGTFPFGRHQLLKLTSWNNECCGYARDQLVYNLEYLKMHEIQNIMFADLRPTAATKFLAHPQADFFLAGRVTPEGTRTLGLGDTLEVHYGALYDLDARRVKPERVYFVAFPNFDNGPDLQRLRRTYSVASVKSYERSGYAIPVYTMRRRAAATPAVAVPGLPGGR